MMGTSICTRRSGGHHMNVTFSMASDTALMWITLGCSPQRAGLQHGVICQHTKFIEVQARTMTQRSMASHTDSTGAGVFTSTGYRWSPRSAPLSSTSSCRRRHMRPVRP